jgi:hypothetical protein
VRELLFPAQQRVPATARHSALPLPLIKSYL